MLVSKKDFKLLIASDQIEEAIDSLLNLINLYSEGNDGQDIGDIYDVLVNNSAKYKGLLHDQNLGIIDSEEAKVTKAEVNKGIMYVINELPESVFLLAKELPNNKQEENASVMEGKLAKEKIEMNQGKKQDQEETTEHLGGTVPTSKSTRIGQQIPYQSQEVNKVNNKKWIYISIGSALLVILLFIWQPWYIGEYDEDTEEESLREQLPVEYQTFTDTRDGKVYKTVKIGNQLWMAENLAFVPKKGFWAYDNHENNVQKYGYLYDWNTANMVCPEGWHLPTMKEFEQLIDFLGGENTAYKALVGDGGSGFSAFFGGCHDGGFDGIDTYTNFWTSTADKGKNYWSLSIDMENSGVQFESADGTVGFSVRCLHD
jgi:uncharacterized protein (TIGR02145 family)